MKHEASPSVRQEWTELSGETQELINRHLADLEVEIDVANGQLTEMYHTDPEAAGEKAEELIQYLDGGWSYMRDLFMVTGSWHYPELAESHMGVLVQHQKTEAFKVVRSNGFAILPVGEGEAESPRIGLSFIAGTHRMSTPAMQGEIELLAFAELSEVSLQYMRPRTPEVVSSSANDVIRAIGTASALLYAYINHEGTTFFQQNAKRQGAFLRSVFESVDAVLPTPGSYDRAIMAGSKTPYLYFRDGATGELYCSEAIKPDTGVEFKAEILGVTTVDVLEHGYDKKYDSPAEMTAYMTGLCAILRPLTIQNIDLSEHGEPDLIIPLRSIKDPRIDVV